MHLSLAFLWWKKTGMLNTFFTIYYFCWVMVFKVSGYITDLLLGERSEFIAKSGLYHIIEVRNAKKWMWRLSCKI